MIKMTWGEYLDSLCNDKIYRNYRDAKRKLFDGIYDQKQEKALEATIKEKVEEAIEKIFNGW